VNTAVIHEPRSGLGRRKVRGSGVCVSRRAKEIYNANILKVIKIKLNREPIIRDRMPSGTLSIATVEVIESRAPKGEWTTPATQEISVAMALSDFSGRWRGSRGLQSQAVAAGTIGICELNQSRTFDLRNDTSFGVVLLQRNALDRIGHESGFTIPELQAHDTVDDPILRSLFEVLLREKSEESQNGALYTDSVGTAFASHLLHHYSVRPSRQGSVGGMAPSVLRRCKDLMEANIESDIRLGDLAKVAGMSGSHFIRSFRESTGQTPYQFLLHQRVKRAQTLMRDSRASLTEVALASGFADQHHLARVFRRVTKMTPSGYRRSL
jgi:AraC family transcriptional regulator